MSEAEQQEEGEGSSQHSTVVWTKPKAKHECKLLYSAPQPELVIELTKAINLLLLLLFHPRNIRFQLLLHSLCFDRCLLFTLIVRLV